MSTNDENIINEPEAAEFGAEAYVEEIRKLKANTVSREEYNKLASQNAELTRAIAEQDYSTQAEEPTQDHGERIAELRKKLFVENKYRSNLEYFTDVIELREKLMEDGQMDPFLPVNPDYRPTAEDISAAENAASQLKEAIEYAAGDPGVFNVELQRRCGIKQNQRR